MRVRFHSSTRPPNSRSHSRQYLQWRRGEFLERTFAPVYDTGGMRRTHLRGHRNIVKGLRIHVAAFHRSLLRRREVGVGTPRGLPDRWNRVFFCIGIVGMAREGLGQRSARQQAPSTGRF